MKSSLPCLKNCNAGELRISVGVNVSVTLSSGICLNPLVVCPNGGGKNDITKHKWAAQSALMSTNPVERLLRVQKITKEQQSEHYCMFSTFEQQRQFLLLMSCSLKTPRKMRLSYSTFSLRNVIINVQQQIGFTGNTMPPKLHFILA